MTTVGRAVCGIYEALWLARLHEARARALYLHVPFCRRKCSYCDFVSAATCAKDPLITAYLDALGRLLTEAEAAGLMAGCETAYIGGGTPTLAGAQLPLLVERVCHVCPSLVELTSEANPDSLTTELATQLSAAGCTRLSVGVQSLDDGELAALGRIHSAEQAKRALHAGAEAGLAVSCDLMCATPGQTDESWRNTLFQALSCDVSHVSIYPLQIEEGTPLEKQLAGTDAPWNEPEIQAHRMEIAREMLEEAGLMRYEVASYARTGCACRHNKAYWTAQPYLGIGTAASSMLTREGYERLRAVAPRLPEVGDDVRRVRLTCTSDARAVAAASSFADLHFDLELLDECQAAAEDLMLAMRMVDGTDPGLVEHARQALGDEALDQALSWCTARGLVSFDGGRWLPTDTGWLLGNELYGRLWELASGEVGSLSV